MALKQRQKARKENLMVKDEEAEGELDFWEHSWNLF
jgi:hypothetical protein